MGLEVFVVAGMAVVASGFFGAVATWAIMRTTAAHRNAVPKRLPRRPRQARAEPTLSLSDSAGREPCDLGRVAYDDDRPSTLVPFAAAGFGGGLGGAFAPQQDMSEDEDDVPTTLYHADSDPDIAAILADLDGPAEG